MRSESYISIMDAIAQIQINPTFEKITWLENEKEVLVTIPIYNIKKQKGLLRKTERGFELYFHDLFQDFYVPFDMELEVDDQHYFFENFTMSDRNFNASRSDLSKPMQGQMTIRGDIWKLGLHELANIIPLYRRFVISIGKFDCLQFYLDSEEFKDEKVHHFYGKVPVRIGEFEFNIYEVRQREERFILIDSLSTMEHEVFGDICHSIMIGYGLLCATFHQDEAFYLSSTESTFGKICDIQYLKLRKTLKSVYNPIYGSPYGRTDDDELAKQVKADMKPLSQELFSKLCDRIYVDKDYASMIILLLEANTASLILRPAGYSVALEQLTNIIADENDGLKPIKNPTLAERFRDDLLDLLVKYQAEFKTLGEEAAVPILKKNIENINRPTNRDKLTQPFLMHGIHLSKLDIQAIDKRNSFLHGNGGRDRDKNKKVDDLDVFHISLRLNVLVNKLIFKHLGYDGRLINHVKGHEDQLKIKIDEDLFCKL